MQHPAGRQILATPTLHPILADQFACPVPGFLSDDGLVEAVVELALVDDLAYVKRIVQQMLKCAPAENDAADFPARRRDTSLGSDA